MATNHQEKPDPITESTPLTTTNQHYFDDDYYEEVTTWSSLTCGWCFGHCFGWRRIININGSSSEKNLLVNRHHQEQEIKEERWFEEKVKKLKEVSEVLAGPKWKNFIRRLSLLNKKRKGRMQSYQYDPQSYALNFDDGIVDRSEVGFSARYAAPVLGINRGHDS